MNRIILFVVFPRFFNQLVDAFLLQSNLGRLFSKADDGRS